MQELGVILTNATLVPDGNYEKRRHRQVNITEVYRTSVRSTCLDLSHLTNGVLVMYGEITCFQVTVISFRVKLTIKLKVSSCGTKNCETNLYDRFCRKYGLP